MAVTVLFFNANCFDCAIALFSGAEANLCGTKASSRKFRRLSFFGIEQRQQNGAGSWEVPSPSASIRSTLETSHFEARSHQSLLQDDLLNELDADWCGHPTFFNMLLLCLEVQDQTKL